jgi:hypothetical protein
MPAPQFIHHPQEGDTRESLAAERQHICRSIAESNRSLFGKACCWLIGHKFSVIPVEGWNFMVCDRCGDCK